jgi:hypothetical protein
MVDKRTQDACRIAVVPQCLMMIEYICYIIACVEDDRLHVLHNTSVILDTVAFSLTQHVLQASEHMVHSLHTHAQSLGGAAAQFVTLCRLF